MNVPTETKVWVGLWLTLAAFNLVIAVANAARGEWGDAFDAFASAGIAAYVAHLIYEVDKAREFRNRLADIYRVGGTR